MAIVARNSETKQIVWGITKDLINEGQRTPAKEKVNEIKASCKFHFKLFDDDGILYYEGYSNDDSSFSPLDWAMGDSGCTYIKYRNPITGKYEML